jgi:RIO kinase 2
MKLNPCHIRYMTNEEFRVLTAVEMGTKNHEIVPTSMIANIANLRAGGTHKIIAELAKNNLIARVQNAKYDGYRLTYGGYDYLALKTMTKRGSVASVGYQIGVGKESDVYIVADDGGQQCVLKIQRLGRVSFRNVKQTRDYLEKRKSASWMYLSRLASIKEFAFMKVLYEHGFPVPKPIDQNRHCVIMGLVEGYPLYQLSEVQEPGRLYAELMDLIVRLAKCGLIHGDFNEFNIMVSKRGRPTIIDFPQMISTSHLNAEFYFNRDVDCIRAFFRKRFNYESAHYPRFSQIGDRELQLDMDVHASGFGRQQQQELDEYLHNNCSDDDCSEEEEGEEEIFEESEEEEEFCGAVEALKLSESQVDAEDEDGLDKINNSDCQPFRDDPENIYKTETGVEGEIEGDEEDLERKEKMEYVRRQVKRAQKGSSGQQGQQRPSARNIMKDRGKHQKKNKSSAVNTMKDIMF